MQQRSLTAWAVVWIAGILAVGVPAGPAAAQLVKVKIGSSLSPPSLDTLTPYIALEQGFFKKHGLDVQIIEFRGDQTHTKALLAGEVDLSANMGATNGMVAASKGARIKLWVMTQAVTAYYFVARREAATTIQGLVGKNIAVSSIGAISYHLPRIALERSGIDPEKVKYVAVGSPADRFKALMAGKIDATMVTTVEAAKLAGQSEIVRLADIARVIPEIPYESGMAREEYIEKNPDTVYRLAKALVEANRWAATNKAGVVAIAKKVLPDESVDVLNMAYDLCHPLIWNPNGDITEAAYKYTTDFLMKVGYMKDPVPYDKFFDRRFVDRAVSDLGRK